MRRSINVQSIREIFKQVQFNKTCHKKFVTKLKKIYDETDPDDFSDCFINCLMVPLSIGEKYTRVENTLIFASKFAVSIYSVKDTSHDSSMEEEQVCPFTMKLFNFLLTHHEVKDKGIRFRVCHFINMLLNSMGEDAFINDDLCDKITAKMLDCLLDKSPKVRAQAVFALHRLQDPTDDACPIITSFIYHLSKDPQVEVRRAIIMNLGKNKKTLQAVLQRTNDVNEVVRKLAYEFLSKITTRSLTIKQRNELLSHGLRDRSEMVSTFVQKVLLPMWLKHFNEDFISFLRALDCENGVDTSILALNALFKSCPLHTIIEQVPIDLDTKLIPMDKITCENVLYWRYVVEHLHREGFQEEMDNILPELLKFSHYIRDFIQYTKQKTFQTWETAMHNFILLQLFELTQSFDLSDEIGRENLKQLILDTLISDLDSEKIIECIVTRLETVIPQTDSRLLALAEVISELRMPMHQEIVPITEDEQHEKNMMRARLRVKLLEVTEEQYEAARCKDYLKADKLNEQIAVLKREIEELTDKPAVVEVREENAKEDQKTMVKCLLIMCGMMQSNSVTTLFPTLKSLLDDMVLPSLDHPATAVVILALKATAICCLLNKDLAKKYIMMFFLQFSIENQDLWLAALKAIFDLLLRYGFDHLGLTPTDDSTNNTISKSKKTRTVRLFNQTEDDNLVTSTRPTLDDANGNIVNILTELLDSSNQDLRTIAAEGLCKLLLHSQVNSASLLSRLIILWHNPVTEADSYLRQCLCLFFNHFVTMVPESQEMMEQAFLPTLKILANAPDLSPLQEIPAEQITKLILNLTRPEIQKTYCHHNNLAFTILAEALNCDSVIEPEILVKSLKYLEVDPEDETIRKSLLEAVEKVLEKMNTADKRLVNLIVSFEQRLRSPTETNVPEQIDAEIEDEVDMMTEQ